MESKAKLSGLRVTARKARLVVDAVRGKSVEDAIGLLDYCIEKEVSRDVSKLIKSAVANMQSKNMEVNIDTDGLKVKEIFVDEGSTMKRFRPRSQGRAGKILKHMCHISVTVSN